MTRSAILLLLPIAAAVGCQSSARTVVPTVTPEERAIAIRDTTIYDAVDTMPRLIGKAKELQSEFAYPGEGSCELGSPLIVRFVVEKDGTTSRHEMLRSYGDSCDNEALRVTSKARFSPGLTAGIPRRVRMSLRLIASGP